MEEYLQHMKNLQTHMNEVEDQAAKISVEEQMQLTTVQNLEKELLFVKNEARRVKEESDCLMKSKGLICTCILEKQQKIASLELDSHNLSQTLDLMQQERASMSAMLNEKRAYFSKVSDKFATELKDQQDWINAHKNSFVNTVTDLVEDKSCSRTCEDEVTELWKQIKYVIDSSPRNVTSGTILKLDDAKVKYNQMSQMKQNLVSEKCKIQQSMELVKGKIQSFASLQPELTKLDLNQLNEEFQAILGDKAGEAEYLQSLQLQIATLREISQMVKCSCGREYKVEVGHCIV